MTTIRIRDVAPRDGLQAERPVSPAERAAVALALADAGIHEIEAASFVSPTAVPAMAGGDEVVSAVLQRSGVTWWGLVPNARGAELAVEAGVRDLTVTISASEQYSDKNVGRSIAEAIATLPAIGAIAGSNGARLDIVVSCAFGSPFGDVTSAIAARDVVARALDAIPTAQVTLADTTGTATPRRIDAVVHELAGVLDGVVDGVGLHLHDTRGTALTNAFAALDLGVTRFDTATGGLGGSPFAPGAGGNLATEDLVLLLHDLGHDTGIDLEALIRIAAQLARLVGHDVPGRVSAAGPLPPFGFRP